ncbi:hypothetical protein JXB02_00675 [Candidatus Woesearchaeota archaeon]|nr:hypothetical protein [Candidatus Woesearchaeota archaeon]
MRIRTCPNCGSTDIRPYMGFETGVQYRCGTCGYVGPIVVERDITLDGRGVKR